MKLLSTPDFPALNRTYLIVAFSKALSVVVQLKSTMRFWRQTPSSSRFLASLVQVLTKLASFRRCWHTVSLWWAKLMKWKQQ